MDLSDTFVREIDFACGKCLKIHQLEVGDVGCVVWDAAIVLSKYLSHVCSAESTAMAGAGTAHSLSESRNSGIGKFELQGKEIVELGSGTGVVGLQAAAFGANVLVTDLPEFVPLMEKNITENTDVIQGKCEAQALVWGKDETEELLPVDLVLIADCLYYDESISPLVTTIEALCGPATTVLCCHEDRSDRAKKEIQKRFFELMEKSFIGEEVPLEEQDPEYRSSDIHIHRFRRQSGKEEA